MSERPSAVIFLVDGLRPDGLALANTRTIDGLAARGAYTWRAQTVMPSISLPCLTSLFLGAPPAVHGITANSWKAPTPPMPGLIDVAHKAGLGTAAIYSWEPCRDLWRPEAADFAYYHRDRRGDLDGEVATAAAGYIAAYRPALAFIYLGALDIVGHDHGWMSPAYLKAIGAADRAIADVLDALATTGALAETICAVLADHGGHDRQHGTDAPADLTIPWILAGPGIRQGHEIAASVRIIDTAPTLLQLLGLPIPEHMTGSVVHEVLAG